MITCPTHAFELEVKERSDRLMNFFLPFYFITGLGLAGFYGTWLIAIGVGGISLIAYYSVKLLLRKSTLYQYVLSTVFGIFTAQFIYQMRGMIEMHFFAFIGSALLITYQRWKLQIPITIVVVVYHGFLGDLQNISYSQVHFPQADYFDTQTFIIHILLAAIVFFICGLWSYQLRLYNQHHVLQAIKMKELEKETEVALERVKVAEALEERNTILESITDAFFAVDANWIVLYWNSQAEKVLGVPKKKILNQYLWDIFADSIDSESYRQYHRAMDTKQPMHFEDCYPPLEKWYDITAYPSAQGLSIYFKDITERKLSELKLTESEKRYSDLFHLSPLPMWVYDLKTMAFLDVNEAAICHYGYSREEFVSMTIKDIRRKEDADQIEQYVRSQKDQRLVRYEKFFRHCTKDGRVIDVDIQSTSLCYKRKEARLVLANDVTERLKYVKAVEEQNQRLKEISWMQSHLVRAPLTKIIGLIGLLRDRQESLTEKEKMLDYLLSAANELDSIIGSINSKSEVVKLPPGNHTV